MFQSKDPHVEVQMQIHVETLITQLPEEIQIRYLDELHPSPMLVDYHPRVHP